MTDRRRARRIASDEAHAWARNLRLGNPYAKLVLCMLTLYVDGDGGCFVSAASLAEDCELALETVRRRLAWLEKVGAIIRRPQWIDDNGRRNGEGKGRRTSDDILLLIDADPEAIEASAKADGPSDPLPQEGATERGSNPPSTPAAPLATPSLGSTAESSEPEPEESPPTPPPGGACVDEDWEAFKRSWLEPMARPSIVEQVWKTLTPELRKRAPRVAVGYFAWRKTQGKKAPAMMSPQTVLRETASWGQWGGYAPPPPAAPPRFAPEDSDEFRAMQVLDVIRGNAPRAPITIENRGNGSLAPATPAELDFLALAQFDPFDTSRWTALDWTAMKEQVASWNRRLKDEWKCGELYRRNRPTGETIDVLGKKYPRMRTVSLVPCEWPPSKSGKIYASTGPPTSPTMSEDDQEFMAQGALK